MANKEKRLKAIKELSGMFTLKEGQTIEDVYEAMKGYPSLVHLGPVVEISRPWTGGPCHVDCDLRYEAIIRSTNAEVEYEYYCAMCWGYDGEPNQDCPGPAPEGHEWRLALFAKEDE